MNANTLRLLPRTLALWVAACALLGADARAQTTFTEVGAEVGFTKSVRSWGASWVDFDGDGDLDLFVSRFAPSGGNALYRNDEGTFTAVDAGPLTTGPGSLGHSWADADNDGDIDVLTVGGTGNSNGFGNTGSGIRLLLNDGGGSAFTESLDPPFLPTTGIEGWTGAWADIDVDGRLDFVIAHPAGFVSDPDQTNALYRQTSHANAGPHFEEVANSPVTEGTDTYTVPTWSDYDLDGDPDLFIGSGPVDGTVDEDNLYVNEGDGMFARITEGVIATDPRDGQVMNWQDIDNDGDLDLFVTNFNQGPDDLYVNDGDGSFTKVTDDPLATDDTGNSLANTWGDVDNDGDLDVFVSVGGSPGTDRLYLNDGDGNFTLDLSLDNGPTSGATLGDYDDDGDLDLAVTVQAQGGAPVLLYRNDTDTENNWLKVDLEGVASNRSAIGAKVYATATIGGEEETQLREVSAQNTFNGQNALTVHVGLGDATTADLRIEWPSGAVDEIANVGANHRLQVVEGQGVPVEPGAPSLRFGLAPPFPNPSLGGASIQYTLSERSPVRLAVYDVLGRRVATLADGVLPAGSHTAMWTGTDDAGRPASAGVYLFRLEAGTERADRLLTRLH